MKKINNVAIVGMGALGMLYGSMITDTLGIESVTYILDDDRFYRYKERTFTVNGAPFHPQFEKANDAKPYDLVIVAVKYNGLDSALDTMKNCIGPDTIIMSVMNGMISEEIIAQRYGMENIVYTVVQGMDAQHSEGTLGYTQKGVVCIGPVKGQTRDNTDAVADFLTRANVAHQVEENILYRMFCKWMLNVGVNQTCMVFDASYNECLTIPEAYDVLCKSMREVIALSPHFDLNLGEEEFEFCDDSENDYKLSYEESYDLKIEIYEDFEKKFSHYLLHDNRANEITFKLWKAFENHISSAQTRSIKMDNKFYLITWLEHNWGAFLGCILDGSFKYMNVASLVLESWNEK